MKKIPGLPAGSRIIPGEKNSRHSSRFQKNSRPSSRGGESYADTYADGDTIPGIVPSTEREGGSPAKMKNYAPMYMGRGI